MACEKEINQGEENLIINCLADTDELIILRKEIPGQNDLPYFPFRTTYQKFKDCLIAPTSLHFTVDDPANEDVEDEITFPLGGGTILFYSKLIGRKAVIIFVNNLLLPQRNVQPDYFTPNFTTGEITRPDGFKPGDYVEVFPL